MNTGSPHANGLRPWNLPTALWGCGLAIALAAHTFAAADGLTLVGPDSSGEYDVVWTTGVLEQASVLGQTWASVDAAGNSYHIAPASDVGNNKFFRLHDGQSFSSNILGYVNLRVPSGFSMIANQLNARPDNTLESVIPSPPENTTIYTYNGSGYNSFNFSVDNPGWFPAHKVLAPGDGAFICIDPSQAPFGTNLTLVGEVQLVWSVAATNLSIISSPIPVSDTLPNLGRPTFEGEILWFFRQGDYVEYSYVVDNPGWFPSIPKPIVGESFFARGLWAGRFAVGPP